MKYGLVACLALVILLLGCVSSYEEVAPPANISEKAVDQTIHVPTKTNGSISPSEDKTELTIPKSVYLSSSIENNCIGFLVGSESEAGTISKVGAGWARPHPGPFSWGYIERTKGKYDFTITDHYVTVAQENNVALLATVWPFADWDQDKSCEVSKNDIFYPRYPSDPGSIPAYRCKPKDMEAYKKFLAAMVERYDGDGIADMPGLKIPVKYWEILNEPEMKSEDLTFFIGNESDYVDLLKQSDAAIKQACPDCNVVQAGCAGTQQEFLSFWDNVLSLGGAEYFDIANIHHIGGPDTDTLNVKGFKSLLSKHGIDKPIWVTEAEFKDSSADVLDAVAGAIAAGASKIFFVSFNVGGHGPPVPGTFSPVYPQAVSLCKKETAAPSNASIASLPVVYYFYSSKCSACKAVAPLYSEIKGNFSRYAVFNEYDLTTKEGMAAFGKFVSEHNITKAYVPTIAIGENVLVGLDGMKRENLYYGMFAYLKLNESDFKKNG